MGLKAGICASRLGLGLETGIWASRLGFEGGGDGEEGKGGEFPICVKAWVIDPFGTAAQK